MRPDRRGLILVAVTLLAALSPASAGQDEPLRAWNAAVKAAMSKGVAGEIGLTDRSATLSLRAVSVAGHPHALGETWRWASVTKQFRQRW